MEELSIEQWNQRLQRVLDEDEGPLRAVIVLPETESTQDAARGLGARPGTVVTTLRQWGGRGRRGRRWADTGSDGAATTFVVEPAPPERLAVACAVAAAEAAERLLGRSVGIKWPNDIVIGDRKLAGILIEQSDGRTYIGIGINVGQTAWPPQLASTAVSLAQLGVRVDRVETLSALLTSMNRWLRRGPDDLLRAFAGRDRLVGTRATFRACSRMVTGTVDRIDPLRGLVVRTDEGPVYLPAPTTTVVSDAG